MINKYMHGHHFRSFEKSRWQDRIQHTRDLLGGCLCKGWKRGPRAGRQSLQTLIQSWYQRKARERGRTGRKSLRPLCHPERIWTMLWGVLEPNLPIRRAPAWQECVCSFRGTHGRGTAQGAVWLQCEHGDGSQRAAGLSLTVSPADLGCAVMTVTVHM